MNFTKTRQQDAWEILPKALMPQVVQCIMWKQCLNAYPRLLLSQLVSTYKHIIYDKKFLLQYNHKFSLCHIFICQEVFTFL